MRSPMPMIALDTLGRLHARGYGLFGSCTDCAQLYRMADAPERRVPSNFDIDLGALIASAGPIVPSSAWRRSRAPTAASTLNIGSRRRNSGRNPARTKRTTADALTGLRLREAYRDGELCAVNPDGTTSFEMAVRVRRPQSCRRSNRSAACPCFCRRERVEMPRSRSG
jgi:hypothetical protein